MTKMKTPNSVQSDMELYRSKIENEIKKLQRTVLDQKHKINT